MSTKAQVQTQAKTPAAPTAARIPTPRVGVPEREADRPDIATQMEGAARLGHSLGSISVSSAPPIIQRQELPEEDEEELQMKWLPTAIQRQELREEAIGRLAVQAKLTVSTVGDRYEQEADRVAEQVVSYIDAPVSKQPVRGQSAQRQKEEEVQTKPAYQIQRQVPENEGKCVREAPLAESITLIGQQQGVQTFVQRGILDKIRGLFGRREPLEPNLSQEEVMRFLDEIERQIKEESEEKEPSEEALSEEDERLLAELEQEEKEKPEKELSDEEAKGMLDKLESELKEEPEEDMSSEEMDSEINKLSESSDILEERYDSLLAQQVKLSGEYAKLVTKKGKEKRAEEVNNTVQKVNEERNRIGNEFQETLKRLTALQAKKIDAISECLEKPIGPVLDEEAERELKELETLDEHSSEHEIDEREEERTEELRQLLESMPEVPKTKPGETEEEEEEEPKKKLVMARENGTPSQDVSVNLEAQIDTTRGSGEHLSKEARLPMEQAFGADFSDVRVHTDAEADALNRQLSAKAFTTGQDIFFGQGEYNPGSGSGRELLAHELTHVLQQGSGRVSGGNGLTVRPPLRHLRTRGRHP